jgi:hypothetical protein
LSIGRQQARWLILFTTIEPRLIFLPLDYDFETLRVPNLAVNPAPGLRWLRIPLFLWIS